MNAVVPTKAVILNGVLPRAEEAEGKSGGRWTGEQAGAKRSSKGCVQHDGSVFGRFAVRRHVFKMTAKRAAFTFVEMLAAMAFLGVLLPVLISALLVSSRAGSVAERSTVAMQLGENQLNELTLGDAWTSAESSGDFGEDWPGYRWALTQGTWQNGEMTELTMTVSFTVQGQEHDIRLSTLVDDSPAEAL